MSTSPLPMEPPRPVMPCPLPPFMPPPGNAARLRSDLDDRRVFPCESAKRITKGTCEQNTASVTLPICM